VDFVANPLQGVPEMDEYLRIGSHRLFRK
jgi:hypothetical protein